MFRVIHVYVQSVNMVKGLKSGSVSLAGWGVSDAQWAMLKIMKHPQNRHIKVVRFWCVLHWIGCEAGASKWGFIFHVSWPFCHTFASLFLTWPLSNIFTSADAVWSKISNILIYRKTGMPSLLNFQEFVIQNRFLCYKKFWIIEGWLYSIHRGDLCAECLSIMIKLSRMNCYSSYLANLITWRILWPDWLSLINTSTACSRANFF